MIPFCLSRGGGPQKKSTIPGISSINENIKFCGGALGTRGEEQYTASDHTDCQLSRKLCEQYSTQGLRTANKIKICHVTLPLTDLLSSAKFCQAKLMTLHLVEVQVFLHAILTFFPYLNEGDHVKCTILHFNIHLDTRCLLRLSFYNYRNSIFFVQ